jgi:hypothetical protein
MSSTTPLLHGNTTSSYLQREVMRLWPAWAPLHCHEGGTGAQNVKDAIVAASERDTRLVMRPLRNTERVLRNAAVDRLLEKEKRLARLAALG